MEGWYINKAIKFPAFLSAGAVLVQGAVLEAAHDEGDHHVALLLRHLGGHGQQHQHVVALRHAHGVQVRQHVGTSDLALQKQKMLRQVFKCFRSESAYDFSQTQSQKCAKFISRERDF